MREDFLHFIWHTARFRTNDLKTCEGRNISIVNRGKPHQDGGPDFIDARIKIDGQLWAGQVEIHVDSSEWFEHKHHLDPLYDGTILHVCLTCSAEIHRTNGTPIPCLELKDRIPDGLLNKYHRLMENSNNIPCYNSVRNVPISLKNITLKQMFEKRWTQKTDQIINDSERINGDWNALLHKKIFRAFGLRINKEPFEQLSKLVNYNLVHRYRENPIYLEALLFGCSGFLLGLNASSEYERRLKSEYAFLKHKHNLKEMPVHQWKFLRLRPANFPTVRLAQLAAFLHSVSMNSITELVVKKDTKSALKLIRSSDISPYWKTHYRFGQKCNRKQKNIGKSLAILLLSNAILPWLSANVRWKSNTNWIQDATEDMTALPSEDNKIVRQFKNLGFEINSAADSQACVHLNEYFCSFKNCLECPIGQFLMK